MTATDTSTSLGLHETQQRRLWLAIALGTIVITVSTWAFLYAFLSGADGSNATVRSLASVAFGMALIPMAFAAVAFVSGHPAAPLATVQAMALSLIVGVPVLAIVQDGLSGVVAGFGVGAAVALCPDEYTRMRSRYTAVLIATALTFLLVHTVVPLALATAPSLPLISVALADRREKARADLLSVHGSEANSK